MKLIPEAYKICTKQEKRKSYQGVIDYHSKVKSMLRRVHMPILMGEIKAAGENMSEVV
jgi:hypothetical protein